MSYIYSQMLFGTNIILIFARKPKPVETLMSVNLLDVIFIGKNFLEYVDVLFSDISIVLYDHDYLAKGGVSESKTPERPFRHTLLCLPRTIKYLPYLLEKIWCRRFLITAISQYT